MDEGDGGAGGEGGPDWYEVWVAEIAVSWPVAGVERDSVRAQDIKRVGDLGEGGVERVEEGGREAKKPKVEGEESRIEAACSFTERASSAAAAPWRMVQPGAVREKMVVEIERSAMRLWLASVDHAGSAHPEGSPPVFANAESGLGQACSKV